MRSAWDNFAKRTLPANSYTVYPGSGCGAEVLVGSSQRGIWSAWGQGTKEEEEEGRCYCRPVTVSHRLDFTNFFMSWLRRMLSHL